MEFKVAREALLEPLQLVVSVVEKRQTLPILSHVLLVIKDEMLAMTGSNLEVELQAHVPLLNVTQEGDFTVSARKLLDICRLLPDESEMHCIVKEAKMTIKTCQGRYSLATLPAEQYPSIEQSKVLSTLEMSGNNLLILLKKTCFSMAQNDVRYFLNGECLRFANNILTAVATNGHRLATSTVTLENPSASVQTLILPRKAVLELMRLLDQDLPQLSLQIGENYIKVVAGCYQFVSKLIEGRFPMYKKMEDDPQSKKAYINRQDLKACLVRVAVLSDEKHRGIYCQFEENNLKLYSDNTQQERAEETLSMDYQSEPITLCVNVDYLLDVLNALSGDKLCITVTSTESSILFEDPEDKETSYIIMPMKL